MYLFPMFEKASRKRISHVQIVNSLVRSYSTCATCIRSSYSIRSYSTCSIDSTVTLLTFLQASKCQRDIVFEKPLINVFYILKLSINLSDHMDYCPTNSTVMLLIFLQSSNCQRDTMFEESCYKHISHVKIHLSDHIDSCITCAPSSYSTCSTNSTVTLLTFFQSF